MNLSHALHDAELLRWYEAFKHDADWHVHVILVNIVSKVHSGVCFGHAYNRLDVTNCYRNTARSLQRNHRDSRYSDSFKQDKTSVKDVHSVIYKKAKNLSKDTCVMKLEALGANKTEF